MNKRVAAIRGMREIEFTAFKQMPVNSVIGTLCDLLQEQREGMTARALAAALREFAETHRVDVQEVLEAGELASIGDDYEK